MLPHIDKSGPEHNGQASIREDGQHHIEVHVAGVCVRIQRGKWKLLAAKRTADRDLLPERWECGGGQVRKSETFPDAIRRQMFEEFGLDVTVASQPLAVYDIPIRKGVIPGIRFLCFANEGPVRLNKREFSSFRWIDVTNIPKLDWVPKLKNVLEAIHRVLSDPSTQTNAVANRKTPTPKYPPGFRVRGSG